MNRTAAIVATAGLALPAAACGGAAGGHAAQTGASTTRQPGAVAFSDCMRSHGVASFPDLPPGGKSPHAQDLGVTAARFETAEGDCRYLLPRNSAATITQCFSTGDCSQALAQQLLNGMREFASCMRTHSVPNWPDPTRDPDNGSPVFNLVAVPSTDWSSPRIEAKLATCQRALPGIRVGLRRP
jgi:hypothetical protein